ncbi:unnamed protein product [Spirodela intermedia]|uniref:3'-5' exonuclease domain-containing protein n=1 Tax=Spirodela intermedia TaxID=51605 RepID=A0A7I8IWD8_SPIIN|nr:unnamed protein product [Spirodela intermedia]CAA6661983.1 unnamed protein product [Spirodela intermedia]
MSRAEVRTDQNDDENRNEHRAIYLHAFSDLSHVSPATFVYLLKECYVCGTVKATLKFRVLQQHVLQALRNSPQSGPAIFVIHCLYILPFLGPPYTEGFSHLLISSLRRLKTMDKIQTDTSDAKRLAAQLFLDILSGPVTHEEGILLKVLEVFNIELKDIAEAMYGSELNDVCLEMAKSQIGNYVTSFVESQSYMTAVTLLERFSVYQSGFSSESFLDRLMQENQFSAAEKWATLMGKSMTCVLVQKYVDMKMIKQAYIMIKKNDLRQEFPDVHHLYKQSSLKKLAEKGCWDVAEIKTNNERQLLEYLAHLAMESGYFEKVDELCERHSLSFFIRETVPVAGPLKFRYLDVKEFILDGISWVDDIEGLHGATSHIKDCRVVGIDCEWKPNYEKGSKPSKVSIMQIASEKRVFIFDLLKLYEGEMKELDECYNFQSDIRQLSHSYGDLECFRSYEMVLDIQKLFKEPHGGLSGVAEKILGAALNKTRRNSNWEQRPLSQNQVEYAALDAAVLVHIFHHVRSQQHLTDAKDMKHEGDWRSHVVSQKCKTRSRKKPPKILDDVGGDPKS